MVLLVMRSRRPRRWAGVALFAGMLALLWWMEHPAIADVEPLDPPGAPEAGTGWDEPNVLRLPVDVDKPALPAADAASQAKAGRDPQGR